MADATVLGDLDRAGLETAVRPLLEAAGPLVGILLGRHFGSWEEVLDALGSDLASADDGLRAAVLRAHPRLGEDPDRLRAASLASWEEQHRGGPNGPDVRPTLAELNDTYEARFGFPFVEWVNGRPLSEIVVVMRRRLLNDRGTELDAGCRALLDIARDRLGRARAGPDGPASPSPG